MARILFEKEINRVKRDLEPCENFKDNQAEKLHQNTGTPLKSISDNDCDNKPCDEKPCDVTPADINSLNHFDMSCLSPLQETAINELFTLVDTRKSLEGEY